MTTVKITFTLLLIVSVITISCKHSETSEIEKIIIDEHFINEKIIGNDSLRVDTNYDVFNTTYYLNNNSILYVVRDSLKRLIAYRMTENNKTVSGAELYETNGQIKGKLNYVNGVIEGEVKYYYEDGRISAKGNFRNGQRWDFWKCYDEEGNLEFEEYYAAGARVTKRNVRN